ncbi:methylated-DNA--[protein]-cysteine S-methyltransferase [Sulfurimonas sp. SAG-AH-194-C20]|nr:methylated-DNA--[protein]-cysteine S-methyltransferase [Sulfurimonas sp. SAG-AH-194-C20]
MNTIHISYFKTDFTDFILGSFEGKLCLADYRYRTKRETIDKRIQKALNAKYIVKDDALLEQTKEQLFEYFAGKRSTFSLPLLALGSEFQKSVWSALREIPYGQTRTYLELSKAIGNEKAVRAVANANGANAISILIPCHRVIGTNGKLTGYAGGLDVKKKLLDLEQNLKLI